MTERPVHELLEPELDVEHAHRVLSGELLDLPHLCLLSLKYSCRESLHKDARTLSHQGSSHFEELVLKRSHLSDLYIFNQKEALGTQGLITESIVKHFEELVLKHQDN